MFFLPEWAPNLHPLIIHFPIGLLIVAFLFDVLSTVLKKLPVWRKATIILYIFGAIATVAAYFTGDIAGDSVFLPTEAGDLLAEHSDLGIWTMGFFVVYALARLVTYLADLEARPAIHGLLLAISLGGLILMYSTAEHGAQLVYQYGVGVQAVDHDLDTPEFPADSISSLNVPVSRDDGGWMWKPTRASGWSSALTFPGESQEYISASIVDGGDHGDVLALDLEGEPVSFVYDIPLQDIQIDASINLDGFDGTLMIINSVLDADHYHFTAIGNGEMRQGRSENGDFYLLDTKQYQPQGWQTYRIISDGKRARAYAGEALVTHGNGPEGGVGPAGLRFNGSGRVLIDFVSVTSLRPVPGGPSSSSSDDTGPGR
jgi:uncharacterized membrane protein